MTVAKNTACEVDSSREVVSTFETVVDSSVIVLQAANNVSIEDSFRQKEGTMLDRSGLLPSSQLV